MKVREILIHLNYPELARCTLCFPFEGVLRVGSVKSNHPELMFKNSTHSAHLNCITFKDVFREGLAMSNNPELILQNSTQLVFSTIMQGSRNFDALELPRTSA